MQDLVATVHMDRALIAYASELVGVTREPDQLPAREHRPAHRVRRQPARHHRVLPDGARAGRAAGPRHVVPDDIAKLAHRVLRHRLILGFEAASAGVTPDVVIDAVLQAVRVP